jgi:hypothetical protein
MSRNESFKASALVGDGGAEAPAASAVKKGAHHTFICQTDPLCWRQEGRLKDRRLPKQDSLRKLAPVSCGHHAPPTVIQQDAKYCHLRDFHERPPARQGAGARRSIRSAKHLEAGSSPRRSNTRSMARVLF